MMRNSTHGVRTHWPPLLHHRRKKCTTTSPPRCNFAALLLLLAVLLPQSVAAVDHLERRSHHGHKSNRNSNSNYGGLRDRVTEVHGEWPRYYDALLRPYARYDHVNIIPHRKHVIRFLNAAQEHGGSLQPKDDFWGMFSVPDGQTAVEEDQLAHTGSSLGTHHHHHHHLPKHSLHSQNSVDDATIEHELPLQRHLEHGHEHEHTHEPEHGWHHHHSHHSDDNDDDDDALEHTSLHSSAVHVRADGGDAERTPCNTDSAEERRGPEKALVDNPSNHLKLSEQCKAFQKVAGVHNSGSGRRHIQEANGVVGKTVESGKGQNLRGREIDPADDDDDDDNNNNNNNQNDQNDQNDQNRRDLAVAAGLANVWMFWESVATRPGYLDLCERTVRVHSRGLQVHVLDKAAARRLLPALPADLDALLPGLAQYSDYVRLALLAKFGGIWLDSDIVVLQDLTQVLDRMCEHGGDFAGFGCTLGLHDRTPCTDNYRHPSNWAMASKPGGQLATWCLKEADRMLDDLRRRRTLQDSGSSASKDSSSLADGHRDARSHGENKTPAAGAKQHYAAFGRELLARFFATHPDYNYYHFPSRCMDRDAAGRIISSSAYILPFGPLQQQQYYRYNGEHHHHLHAAAAAAATAAAATATTTEGEHAKSQLALSSPRRGCSEAAEDMPLLLPLYNTAGHSTAAWSAFKNLTAAEILVGGGKKLKLVQNGFADPRRNRGRSRRHNVGAFDALGDVAALAHGPAVDTGTGLVDASHTYLASIFRLALAPGDELVAHAYDGV